MDGIRCLLPEPQLHCPPLRAPRHPGTRVVGIELRTRAQLDKICEGIKAIQEKARQPF